MSLAQQVFTDAGKSMLGRAQASETLTISKIVLGDGSASQDSDYFGRTTLFNKRMDVTITSKTDLGGGVLLVEGSFLSSAAPAAFQLRELGIQAHIGAEADRLYCASNVYTDPPDTIDPSSPSVQAFKIKLIVDRIPSAQLVIQIGPTENITGENVGSSANGPGWFKEAVANLMRFKRAKAGAGISIVEDASGDFITIAEKQLTQNFDLYVPANNPDYVAGPNTAVFADIQAAHDYLLQFRIPANITATIHVHELNHAIMNFGAGGTSIAFSHPDSKQIALIGEARVDKAVTKIQWVSNTQKDVTCTDVTGLAVGMYVWLALSPGYGGGCQIASVNTSTKVVRVNIWNQSGKAPYNTLDTNANRLSYLPTKLQISPNPTVLGQGISCPNGIQSIQNILVIGHSNANLSNTYDQINYLSYAFTPNSGSLINCMAVNARRGLSGGTGAVSLSGDCVFANCGFGIVGGSQTLAYYDAYTYINGCGQGVLSGGTFALGSIVAGNNNTQVWLNHNLYGANITGGVGLIGGTWWVINNWTGIQATSVGSISLGAGYGSFLLNNTIDIRAQGQSYVRYDRWELQMPTCDPAVHQITPPPAGADYSYEGIGNQNACIYVLDTGSGTRMGAPELTGSDKDFHDRAMLMLSENSAANENLTSEG